MVEIKNLVRPNILNLKPYSSARDEFSGKEGVFLDANENPYGTLNRYPDPYQKELKQKLSKLKEISTEHIFIGNGSDEVIDLAFRIFCNPGQHKALTFSPTYGMYQVSAAINDVELIQLPLNASFQIDLEVFKPFLSENNLKLIFICSPNNPTGNVIDKKTIEFILNQFNGIVIIDEAYIDFSKEPSLIGLVKEYNNLIISQTFSKAWGLAAARVGIAYTNKEIISLFNKVKPPYNVSKLNQKAAMSALDNIKLYEENVALILSEKKRLKTILENIDGIKKIYPSEANFLLLEVNNANELYEQLIEQKIIIRNRHNLVHNCIRITIGTVEENKQLINAIKNLV